MSTEDTDTEPAEAPTDRATAEAETETAEPTSETTETTGAETETAEPTPKPVVDLEGVTFGYTAAPVVEDVTLTVDPGEYVAIVGPNGSGKSTLLKLLLGLLEPDEGTAHLFGKRAAGFDDGDRVGYVAQQASAAKDMPITVREVVKMGRFSHVGFSRLSEADWAIVDDALATVGMSAFADRRVTQLSGGQRQRAIIARALASEAELLVLDEPTVGVDAESVDAFYDLLAALNDQGITVLLIEHDLGAVARHADRVVCLNREVYFDGPSDEFVESDALARAFGTEARFLTGADE